MEEQADIAVIGLAVMGQNLILNMADHGFKVAAFNRTLSKVDDFIAGPAKGKSVIAAHSIEELIGTLKSPKKIMMMVKAGSAVDETIANLAPHLSAGDILIDGGNTLFTDTIRRQSELNKKGIYFIGMGISGGEEGARFGPSIMPGGNVEAWEQIKNIFQSIAALGSDNSPCCDWVGAGGAGHYVKMVHNGIEYGDMQLISEAYFMLKTVLKLNNEIIADIFSNWNNGVLNSYLIQITSEILRFKDSDDSYLVDKILDSAGQKGTGKWAVINASESGQPISVIAEALFARFISSLLDVRRQTSQTYPEVPATEITNPDQIISDLGKALYCAKIISYAQGYMMMSSASNEYSWQLNYANVAQLWTGGCIIRSRFLKDIKAAYTNSPNLTSLLLDNFFISAIKENESAWRSTVELAVKAACPSPALTASLAFFDSIRSERLPANLIQAQRDYFGAHTYERLDKARGEYFHTNWSGRGGDTSAESYNT